MGLKSSCLGNILMFNEYKMISIMLYCHELVDLYSSKFISLMDKHHAYVHFTAPKATPYICMNKV